MSGYACPHCDEITPVFGAGGGEAFCQAEGITFLGGIPIDAEFVKLLDQSEDGLVAATTTNGNTQDERTGKKTVLQRYQETTTSKVFQPICQMIQQAVETDATPITHQ